MTTKSRRGHNEGSVFYVTEKGFWRAMVTLDGHRLSHTGETRKECQAWIKKTIAQIDNGLTFDGAQITLNDFLADWLVSIKASVKPHTWYQYDMTVRKHIVPYIGKITLNDLRPEHIQKLYDKKLKDGSGARTVQFTHLILHKSLNHALKLGTIPRNPTETTYRPKIVSKEMKFYDEGQVAQLLLAVRGSRDDSLYQLVVSTGMRQSEVLGLKWSDLDWRNKTITIRRQLVRLSKTEDEFFSSVKTNAGKRTITLGDQTLQKLREHMALQDDERKHPRREKWVEYDLIFPSITGTPMNQSNLYHSFKRLIQEAGLPEIRFHDLRHSAASIMLNHGVAPMVVAKRLGHSKVSVTLDTYGHLIPELHDDVAQFLDDLITPVEVELVSSNISTS